MVKERIAHLFLTAWNCTPLRPLNLSVVGSLTGGGSGPTRRWHSCRCTSERGRRRAAAPSSRPPRCAGDDDGEVPGRLAPVAQRGSVWGVPPSSSSFLNNSQPVRLGTASWLLVAGLFWEKSTAGCWLISRTNRPSICAPRFRISRHPWRIFRRVP
jgi:hypothetical protein